MRIRGGAWWVVAAALLAGTACTSAPSEPAEPSAALAAEPATPRPSATNTIEPQHPEKPQDAEHPTFEGSVSRVGRWLAEELIGRNWHPGCPVGIEGLRVVRVSYWNFHGDVRTGPIVVNETQADGVLWVFRQLFRAEFPIHRIALPHTYRRPKRSDWFSTRDRTSGFNCRPATGNPGSLSHHSYGWAIDINPLENPYIASDGSVLRKAAKTYVERSQHEPGMIHPGDVVVRSFAHIGWEWGGDWVTIKDYMHFSLTGR